MYANVCYIVWCRKRPRCVLLLFGLLIAIVFMFDLIFFVGLQ